VATARPFPSPPLSLPSAPYCPRRPSLDSLPSHRLAVSSHSTDVKPRAIRYMSATATGTKT
ncbi:hypothetical protein BHE74_00018821, partial [Ensete ventricosum]